jgi:hypothetical protein
LCYRYDWSWDLLCRFDVFKRVLLCIIFFLDGTNVTKNGSVSFFPLYVSIGNLSDGVRQRVSAWVVIGLVPILDAKGCSSAQEVKDAKAHVLNSCLGAVVKSIRDTYKEGGFYLEVQYSTIYVMCC